MKYYVGADVGVSGVIGILDRAGVVGAHRWQVKNPVLLYNHLSLIKGLIDNIYT